MTMPGTPTPDPPIDGPPPNWTTQSVTWMSFEPTPGPVNNETATDDDFIQAAAPSSPDTDGVNDDTIGGTPAEAVALVTANYAVREERTHVQGMHLAELVDLPPAPDVDSTVLQGPPA